MPSCCSMEFLRSFPKHQEAEVPQSEVSEITESEDMGTTTMDIEENDVAEPGQECQFTGMNEELHQQQQQHQHCVIPQIPHNTATPLFGIDDKTRYDPSASPDVINFSSSVCS
ncbi:hypothetical protein Acr_01g0003350 [Actinidia rufa]|uniref:Uncharacterized protein n=1 Tax=Actinidia rufa TaxID=165716 RepID=A0A7J0E334_9ERIC|nr:hypothetical protein Acr_01g0003350 [Actinidia rufa]